MKNFCIKYVNLLLIYFLLVFPLRKRAKILWFLFSFKQKLSQIYHHPEEQSDASK